MIAMEKNGTVPTYVKNVFQTHLIFSITPVSSGMDVDQSECSLELITPNTDVHMTK